MLWLYYFYDYVIDNANWHSEPLMFSELKILFGGVFGPLPQFSLQILSVLQEHVCGWERRGADIEKIQKRRYSKKKVNCQK